MDDRKSGTKSLEMKGSTRGSSTGSDGKAEKQKKKAEDGSEY